MERAQLNYVNKAPPKKKRKSRTAFTNHQIFELEKRFLYQKYLSPADRDEIAAHLGLTNAQVAFFSSLGTQLCLEFLNFLFSFSATLIKIFGCTVEISLRKTIICRILNINPKFFISVNITFLILECLLFLSI